MNLDQWLTESPVPQAPDDMTLPLDLEHKQRQGNAKALLRSTSLGVVALGLWAAFTPMRELALAPGQITPEAGIRALQHLEGGVVSALPVEAGALVRAGDTLIIMAPAQADADFGQINARFKSLASQQQQIEALLQALAADFNPAETRRIAASLAARDVFEPRLTRFLSERGSLLARIGQRKAEIEGIAQELRGLRDLVASQGEQLAMRDALLAQGYTSRKSYLEASASMAQAQSQKSAAEGRLAVARQALEEAQGQLQTSRDEARRLWSEEAGRLKADGEEAQAGLGKFQDRQQRLVIRAPIDGLVQMIVPRSPGEVVKPGDIVARIVPTGSRMIAEVQVKPDDIGHVKIGNRADIKFSTFDSAMFGVVSGHIASLSPTTFQKENGEPYYRATIEIPDATIGAGAYKTPIMPGMVVSAEIVTGERSLFRYLLRPVLKNAGAAFSER